MTKCAALELARHHIRVNSVHPGLIDTDMLTDLTGNNTGIQDRLVGGLPMQRLAQPIEVARLVLFLASDDSSY